MGCPHTCSFCNQRTISSALSAPSAEDISRTLAHAAAEIPHEKKKNTEIAFFGGSFTAIDRSYMISLLEAAYKYVFPNNTDGFGGIRISTRPDCIDEEVLMLLKKYGVTAIELGAQSMSDRVLRLNERGHTANDVRSAVRMIKNAGLETGLQMMVGLYGSSPKDELYTMNEIALCRSDTVRIYPVAVLEGTALAKLYKSGEYRLFSFDTCIELCAEMLKRFHEDGIRVIRLGLHAQDGIAENSIAGFYHPAFAELVRSHLFRQAMHSCIERFHPAVLTAEVCSANMSCAVGHKRSNKNYLQEIGINAVFRENNDVGKDEIILNKDVYNVFKITGDARV